MSFEIVEKVHKQNPRLLQENIGSTCNQFKDTVIEHLRAAGHQAFSICKTTLDGAKYIPLGFQPRDVIGLDGKGYRCIGVSHDAIWCDGKQYDLIVSGNYYDRPIYRRNGEPNWSFDPSDGARITAGPAWEEIPAEYWRPHNPPLIDVPVTNQPKPQPPAPKVLPKGEAFAALQALNAFYQAPEGLQRPGGLVRPDGEGRSVADMEAIAQWFYQIVIEGVPLEAVFAQIKASDEWRGKHPGQ